MNKRDEITDGFYVRLRSTGSQPARLYGLAKVYEKDTPLRPVLSLPSSFYEKLKRTLANFFDKIEGANIESNTEAATVMIENTNLDYDESIISRDVKSLYTNVLLKDAIDIALKNLYSQIEPPDLSRSTRKRLLYMVVSNDTWYAQKDGLSMGASLAVILANLCLKDYVKNLAMDIPQNIDILEYMNGKCPKCNRRVTFRTKAVEW